ncbi:MAG: S8 family serine peptidase [Geodermatophilaceae bacterium]
MAATMVAATFAGPAAAAPEGVILGANGPTAIADSYIVVLRDTTALRAQGVPAVVAQLAARHRGSVERTYLAALQGFSTTMSEANARRLAAEPAVAYVEQDHTVQASATQTNPPSWGLDRIDQRDLPLNNSYTYPTTASNVRAYIIDTGVRFTHSTFGGRATSGRDTVNNDNDATDCNGHGTHVAGTVGGSAYGVAKGVQIVGVRVLDCAGSGSNAGVIAGVDWVTANAVKPATANMSLGGSASTALDTSVRNSINSGISYGLAAGNENANACNGSPSRVAEGITVGATAINDARASYSNYGTCLDIFAPGVNITSSWYTSDTATNTISGTSMATPHVVGAAALYLATNPGATPQQVRDNMVNTATLNKVTDPRTGSPNRLLFVTQTGVGNTVTVTNPGSRTGTVGTATSLQIQASSSQTGQTLTYSATGLPSGLSISSSTGLISGTPTAAGTFTTTASASDTTGASGSATFSWTINGSGGGCPSPGQKLGNPGFESATAAPWTASTGVIDSSSGQPARTGVKKAWLNGYGTTHTDTLSQTVTVPAGCSAATFSFWLRTTSSETTTTVAYDKLTVTVGSATLATYSNLNENTTYTQKSFSLAAYAGQTVTLKFTGVEDSSLETSFVVDDTALDVLIGSLN